MDFRRQVLDIPEKSEDARALQPAYEGWGALSTGFLIVFLFFLDFVDFGALLRRFFPGIVFIPDSGSRNANHGILEGT